MFFGEFQRLCQRGAREGKFVCVADRPAEHSVWWFFGRQFNGKAGYAYVERAGGQGDYEGDVVT
jgi:hypothetical protein